VDSRYSVVKDAGVARGMKIVREDDDGNAVSWTPVP
jgi:hypothetical protein